MVRVKATLHDVIAEAIYDDGNLRERGLPGWRSLSAAKRAGWLEDADRVLKALRRFDLDMQEAEKDAINCGLENPGRMCARCDCWKKTREYCS